SPDGTKAVVCSEGISECEMLLVDLKAGRIVSRWSCSVSPVRTLSFADAGAAVVALFGDGSLWEWNVVTGKQVRAVDLIEAVYKGKAPRARFHGAAFSPDGRTLAVHCHWLTEAKGTEAMPGVGSLVVFDTGSPKQLWGVDGTR